MSDHHTTIRYEERDIKTRDVLFIAFGVLLCTIGIVCVLYLLFSYMRNLKAQESQPTSPR